MGLDLEEELEVLGWGLGFDNIGAILLLSIFLTGVCICAVCIINTARKLRASCYMARHILYSQNNRLIKFVHLRAQHSYIQEFRMVGSLGRHFKMFHQRRV